MTNHAESYFTKISNNILEAAELIVTRFDEGLAVIMTGKLPEEREAPPGGTSDNIPGPDEFEMEMEEDIFGSPLEGMADSVLKDIMKGQAVCFLSRRLTARF
jgi:hypothetical protein